MLIVGSNIRLDFIKCVKKTGAPSGAPVSISFIPGKMGLISIA